MRKDSAATGNTSESERARLRAEVLALGGILGWQPQEVIRFTEELTDCPWHRCGRVQFQAALAEYLDIAHAIEERALLRAGRGREAPRCG